MIVYQILWQSQGEVCIGRNKFNTTDDQYRKFGNCSIVTFPTDGLTRSVSDNLGMDIFQSFSNPNENIENWRFQRSTLGYSELF